MHKNMAAAILAVLLGALTASGCTMSPYGRPTSAPIPTLAVIDSTLTLQPLSTEIPIVSSSTPSVPTSIPVSSIQPTLSTSAGQTPSANFCADTQPKVLIDSFKTALQTSNGPLLASLVSPVHGMEARLYRNGRVVTYDQQHAQFLFPSNYVVDWGAAPASGLETKGSFHQIILPALLKVFNEDYSLDCDQVEIGGSTYRAVWPYVGVNYYSVYFPGTPANGNLDWRTWLIGMEYVNGKPYLYALTQFFWEP